MRRQQRQADEVRRRNEERCSHLLDRSALVEVDDLDWHAVGQVALPAGVLDTLVYMRDVEGFTDSYVAGLGAHPTTVSDPLVGRFLDVWRAEEAAHSRALDRYLTTYAARRGVLVPAPPPAPACEVRALERAVTHVRGTVGRMVCAAHMAWGAANELLTMNGYRALADESPDPVLAELLSRIAAQESRHYAFYLLQAEWRLAASPLARVVLPRVLAGSWTPVGIGDGYKTHEEFARVLAVLDALPSAERRIERMDRRFSALPGFERLRIFGRALHPEGAEAPPLAAA